MALKVFDLQCQHGHVFEGWFASHDDYDAQRARGLVVCPMCESKEITKRLSAPHLNVSHLHAPAAPAQSAAEGEVALAALQSRMLRQVRELVRSAENVGPRFAEEARRIHEGEADGRPIRGTATQDEQAALAEDGIDFLPLPAFLDDGQLQ